MIGQKECLILFNTLKEIGQKFWLPGDIYSYDDEGNLLTLVTIDAAEDILDSFTYVYDDNSIGYKNQISKTEIVSEENKGTTSYEYDIQGRLAKVTNPDGSTNEYTYDNAGNRLSKTSTSDETVVVTTYTYDEENCLTQSVTGGATTYYGYDNNGNQISEWTRIANVAEATDGVSLGLQSEVTDDLLTSYEYDVFDILIKIEQGTDVIENAYTADGKSPQEQNWIISNKYDEPAAEMLRACLYKENHAIAWNRLRLANYSVDFQSRQ